MISVVANFPFNQDIKLACSYNILYLMLSVDVLPCHLFIRASEIFIVSLDVIKALL